MNNNFRSGHYDNTRITLDYTIPQYNWVSNWSLIQFVRCNPRLKYRVLHNISFNWMMSENRFTM